MKEHEGGVQRFEEKNNKKDDCFYDKFIPAGREQHECNGRRE